MSRLETYPEPYITDADLRLYAGYTKTGNVAHAVRRDLDDRLVATCNEGDISHTISRKLVESDLGLRYCRKCFR